MQFMPSDSEAVRRTLLDMQHHIAKAGIFAAGLSHDAFVRDDLRFYAVTRCLEIISEASRRLPDELKARHPSIAWRDMAASGNIYRHEYEDVAAHAVWDTLTLHLPPSQAVLEAELSEFGS
jgi:uncharacterized protein with HEPN domain